MDLANAPPFTSNSDNINPSCVRSVRAVIREYHSGGEGTIPSSIFRYKWSSRACFSLSVKTCAGGEAEGVGTEEAYSWWRWVWVEETLLV